jgi:histidinol dehydrogenase
MSSMKIIRTQKETSAFLRLLARRGEGVTPQIAKTTEQVVNSVRRQGDRALLRFTRKYDGHGKLRINPAEIKKHSALLDSGALRSLKLSAVRIRKFHERQKESSWHIREKGAAMGQLIRPLERVGVYVPGGKASYPSTVLMNVIPAQVAGVREIALVVPTPGGEISPGVMAAIGLLGITEVYSIGGAQAVAALAYGTETVRKVDKIVGPGNIYVATAKKMVFGTVDIDMIAGPSEILVIADSSAEPRFVASDLLSQAEHDELASSVLVTDSEALALSVSKEVARQLAVLTRRAIARESLRKYGAVIIVKDMEKAAGISNMIAPEHLEVMTRSPRKLIPLLRNAGAIFLGRWTPEPLGDYSAGPNHTLPTGGTARWGSPLGVYDFIKRTSLLQFSKAGFLSLADTVETVADMEGLEAHANAVRIRKSQKG